jgi:phage terminase large subunit
VFQLNKRIRAVAGGTSASKTVSILVWLIDYAQSTRGELISIVSESYPHLEKGAMLDFENIMRDRGYWDEARWHKTKHTYTFETGSKIEFFSVDTYGKAHGPRRDVLFVNEANNLSYKIVDQLIVRTRKVVWLDWNPSETFWFYEYGDGSGKGLQHRPDVDFITLTYLDNEALDSVTVNEIESHKENKAWWTVYGLGLLGATEARIYTNWNIIDEVPNHARLRRRGQDWGYSNDPTALIDVYEYDGGLVLDEQLYQKGMLNKPIADFIKNLPEPQTLVIADSAEPKSIAELKLYGVNVLPCEKGADSVRNGIAVVQDQKISITKRSLNTISEYRKYLWLEDKDGNLTREPAPGFDHAMDAIRYAIVSLVKKPKVQNAQQSAPPSGYYNDLGI